MTRNYRKAFYNLYLKKSFGLIPKLILVMLLSLILVTGFIYVISESFGDEVGRLMVGYVFDNEELWFNEGIKYMGRTVNARFIKYNEDEGMKALESEEIVALIVVENDEDKILNSNLPISKIRFIHPDNEDFLNRIFDDVVQSGITDFMVLNANRDVVSLTTENYSKLQMTKLESHLLNYIMKRNKYYEIVSFYDAGDIPLEQFYKGNIIAIVSMLTLSVILGSLKEQKEDFLKISKTKGIRNTDYFLARYLPVSLFYIFISVITVFFIQEKVSIGGIISMILAQILILETFILIHELIRDRNISILVSVLISVVFSFVSGNLIPMAFLPKSLNLVGNLIPTKYASKLIGQVFYGKTHGKTIIWACIFMCLLLVVIIFENYLRGKNYDKD